MDEKFIPKLRFSGFTKVWESTRIGEIAEVVGGGTPKTEVEEYWNGEIKWFTPSEIGKTKYLFDSERHITDNGLKNSSAKLLPKYTILLSSRATVGEISIALTECSTNQGFQSLITKNNVDNEFIYYLISTIKNEFLRRSSGSTFLEISKNEIKRIPINIPELSEQNKISNLFSAIDNKIEMLEKKCQYYQDFKKYLMQRIFSSQDDKLRFQDFTDDWVVTTLDKIAIKIGDGLHSTPDYVENSNYYFINGNNLLEGQIIINDNTKCIPPYEFEKYNNNLNKNTILISINGTIGNLAYYNDEKVILGKSAAYIKLNENIEKEYIYNYLKIGKIQHYFSSELTGTTIKNLSLKTLKNTPIIIPSYNEQKIIANMFKNIDLKIDLINNRLTNMKNFKKGLLQQMFI